MAITKYTKWIPSPLDGLSLEELLDEMSEFLLQSGFQYGFQDISNPHDLEALRQAIIEKLVEMGRSRRSCSSSGCKIAVKAMPKGSTN